MPTSGSVDFSVSRDDIIVEAMQQIGALGQEETPSFADITDCSRTLNMLVKQYQGSADFSQGVKIWSRKRHIAFMNGFNQIQLGQYGDPSAASGFATSVLTGSEATAQTAIGVASEADFTNGDSVGVVLDTGSIYWATLTSKSAGNLNITPGLPSPAAQGNRVFGYTARTVRPLSIIRVALREYIDNNGLRYNDTLLDPMTDGYLAAIFDKRAVSTPSKWYYEPQLAAPILCLDCVPNDPEKVLFIEYVAPIEDFDSMNDTPDYPQEWFLALSLNLAKLICPKYKMKWTKELEENLQMSLAIAKNLNPDTSEEYFQPDL